jgi:hypothetical protein
LYLTETGLSRDCITIVRVLEINQSGWAVVVIRLRTSGDHVESLASGSEYSHALVLFVLQHITNFITIRLDRYVPVPVTGYLSLTCTVLYFGVGRGKVAFQIK